MRKTVLGYDTAIITLRDGHVYVWQGEGDVAVVSGSVVAIRDPRLRFEEKQPEGGVLPIDPNTKWCSNCGDWKPRSDFSPDKRNADKLHGYCKDCRNHYRRLKYGSRLKVTHIVT